MLFLSLILLATFIPKHATADVVSCDPCIDRQHVNLGCVHHGIPSQDVFWQFMDASIAQGAKDMGINLLYEPITDLTLDERDEASVEMYMQQRIRYLCREVKVNGIFVSLPSPAIINELNGCREAGIPAIVFNSGIETAKANGYLYIGQDEFQAGLEAGQGLAEVDGVETFCCLNHAPGVNVLKDRCGGFGAGLEANGMSGEYADVHVDPNDCASFEQAIVSNCSPATGNWSSVGLYFGGQANHECGLRFLRKYPATFADASDVSEYLYAGMAEGLNILFGIDQQTYLQGYFPSSFLTLASTNDQTVQNENIETGPKLINEPPSEHYQDCKARGYAVCDATGSMGSTTSSSSLVLPRLEVAFFGMIAIIHRFF